MWEYVNVEDASDGCYAFQEILIKCLVHNLLIWHGWKPTKPQQSNVYGKFFKVNYAKNKLVVKLGKEFDLSRLASQTRNIGYYAGLTFGIGYCLTLIGVIAVVAELMARVYALAPPGAWGYVPIPPWLIAALIFFGLGMICAIYFGLTIIRNSKSARDSGLKIDTISSSVYAYAFMLIFVGVGGTILAAGLRLSLFSPICGVVGPILLLVGFRAYCTQASESKIVGAILMLISVALIYFVAYRFPIPVPFPIPGPLTSEMTLEAIALMIAIVCAVVFAFPVLEERLRQPVAGIILSISGIIFTCGVMYFNFWAVSAINTLQTLLGQISHMGGLTPWFPKITLDSIWVIFFGFLLLGISGIIALVTACLPLAISAKQLSAGFEAPRLKAPEVAPPKPAAEVKYCPKCGASMPLDAIYCPKCAHRQTQT